ncbi:Uncharacterized N-acetyltransferase ycf52 [Seminavis robusta]|uniref:Uncharacterized N-acetyltransferase ycf52 n=1 Tax=Seminavis robusta TaxID=568900 RepID=A0A9N8HCR4_9STRA|nr:Uncharacterized N-acetyltransferase ycf52 [Seminavis robusta]|eukprot:Sro392_g133350.1 Uncharacterized N-acetyltransferase ycf52 (152) ;mRNA; f:27097-27552
MKLVYDLTNAQIATLHSLYQKEWWTKGRSLEETQSCVSGSSLCVGLVDDDENLVGFSRVLTDYTFKALIFDVIVSSNHRGSGLGERLLRAIFDHKKLYKVKNFELYCAPEMEKYYQKFGFSTDVGGVLFLRKTRTSLVAKNFEDKIDDGSS